MKITPFIQVFVYGIFSDGQIGKRQSGIMILHNVLLWFQHVKVIGHFRVNTGPVLLLLLSLLQRTFLIVPQREVSDTCMTLHTLHTGLPLYLHLFVTNWQFSIRINPGRRWMENLKPVFICWKSIVFISQTERALEHAPVTDNILRVNVDVPPREMVKWTKLFLVFKTQQNIIILDFCRLPCQSKLPGATYKRLHKRKFIFSTAPWLQNVIYGQPHINYF